MRQVNIHQAKTHLSRLVEAAAAGEEIIIAKAGKPMAKLSAVQVRKRKKGGFIGRYKGRIHMSEDFDAPLPREIAKAFGVK